nr:hypothetical protein [Campylobacter cuniculorum]
MSLECNRDKSAPSLCNAKMLISCPLSAKALARLHTTRSIPPPYTHSVCCE